MDVQGTFGIMTTEIGSVLRIANVFKTKEGALDVTLDLSGTSRPSSATFALRLVYIVILMTVSVLTSALNVMKMQTWSKANENVGILGR